MGDFIIQDCTLLSKTSGISPAINLRELRDRLATCRQDALYHHFCETPLLPSFDNPDYRNDFAGLALMHLGDRVLAERLGIIDPYILMRDVGLDAHWEVITGNSDFFAVTKK